MTATPKLHLKQHFTEAKELNELMCGLLGSVEGQSVQEPSVGHGAFLANLIGAPRSIHVVDIDPDAIATTTSRFRRLKLVPFCEDFIDVFLEGELLARHPLFSQPFDAVISNPPYGLYLTKEYRARLKRAFPSLHVRESYGLFFAFSISRLRDGGRYVFLIPDTFLSSTHHTPLRRYIADVAAPSTIIRFASKRFETVRFGYGNLCIIAGERRPLSAHDEIRWIDATDCDDIIKVEALDDAPVLSGQQLLEHVISGWSTSCFARTSECQDTTKLGDLAECRTGIYSGDNVRFIGYDPKRVSRRLNGHPIDWTNAVVSRELTSDERQFGISGGPHYVPLVRGGHRQAFEIPSSGIDWSVEAVAHYKADKKARFQNSQFYFKEGIAVPMVSAGRISASWMHNAVFDQGVVGVFPRDPEHLWPLLLYLNSGVASKAVKALVNGSANNSANYLKRLPIPAFDDLSCRKAALIVSSAKEAGGLDAEICDAFAAQFAEQLPS